jgi:hypothetical protein
MELLQAMDILFFILTRDHTALARGFNLTYKKLREFLTHSREPPVRTEITYFQQLSLSFEAFTITENNVKDAHAVSETSEISVSVSA